MNRFILTIILSLLGLPGCQRTPQIFLDGYGGLAMPGDLISTVMVPAGALGFADLDFEEGPAAGGRVGVYFPTSVPIQPGAAIDASVALAEVDGADLTNVPVSFLAMVRFPINQSDERPHGMLQPYVGAGPSVIFTEEDDGVSATTVGIDLRAGVSSTLYRAERFEFGPFLEYRFLYQESTFDGLGGSALEIEVEAVTHYVLGGLSFRF